MIEMNLRVFNDLLQIERERQLIMQIMNNALSAYEKHIDKEITKEVEGWMKSLFS